MSIQGIEVTARRLALGLEPIELAELIGIDRSNLLKVERGERALPTKYLRQLEAIEEIAEGIVTGMVRAVNREPELPEGIAVTIKTFASNEAMFSAYPRLEGHVFSAKIHRACAGQALRRLLGQAIEEGGWRNPVIIVED